MLQPPAFFRSEIPIRPRSKISRHKIPGVCLGFCQSVSVPRVAEKTGLSVKTVRNLYKSIRGLLLDPRYRKWHKLDDIPIYEFTNKNKVHDDLWRGMAECHLNDECFRNYRYKKRADRECQNCPLRQSEILQQLLTPDLISDMLERIDTVRAYYQVLIGISRDKDLDPVLGFRLRLYHTTILLNAKIASSRVENGIVSSSMLVKGEKTLNQLWMTILNHIEEKGQI